MINFYKSPICMIGPSSLEVALGWQAAFCLRLHRFSKRYSLISTNILDRVAFFAASFRRIKEELERLIIYPSSALKLS